MKPETTHPARARPARAASFTEVEMGGRIALGMAGVVQSVDDPRLVVTVQMPDGRLEQVGQLLTGYNGENPKLAKSILAGYRTAGLALLPHRLGGAGNLCPGSTPGCRATCLNLSGKGPLPMVQRRRLAKTLAYRQHRRWFVRRLAFEIDRFERRCRRDGVRPAVRLNVLSDLPWETLAPAVFARHPDVRYYDYTKIYTRMARFLRGELPPNYTLCFSRSEENEADCLKVLRAGGTVAVVFGGDRPRRWRGYRVVDGDAHDLRFLDPAGTVVGLSAKGLARRDASGFVVWGA